MTVKQNLHLNRKWIIEFKLRHGLIHSENYNNGVDLINAKSNLK